MTTPSPSPTVPGSGSVLDGDPRVLIPLCLRRPSGWGSRAGRPTSWPARAGCPPPAWGPAICMCRSRCCAASNKKGSPLSQTGVRWRDPQR
jgi:hypothetical protein